MSLMNTIARILRAMARASKAVVKKTIWVGDRFIEIFVPSPMPVLDELEPAAPSEVDVARADGHCAAVRNLAAAMQGGGVPAPELFAAAGEPVMEWLACMPEPMLKQVIRATDDELAAHMRGRRTIRGLLHYSPSAIADYAASSKLREIIRQPMPELVPMSPY